MEITMQHYECIFVACKESIAPLPDHGIIDNKDSSTIKFDDGSTKDVRWWAERHSAIQDLLDLHAIVESNGKYIINPKCKSYAMDIIKECDELKCSGENDWFIPRVNNYDKLYILSA